MGKLIKDTDALKNAAALLNDVELFKGQAEPSPEPPDPKEYDPEVEEEIKSVLPASWSRPVEVTEDGALLTASTTIEPMIPPVAGTAYIPLMVTPVLGTPVTPVTPPVIPVPPPVAVSVAPGPRAEHGLILIERTYQVVHAGKTEPTEYKTKTLKTPVTRFLTVPAMVGIKFGATMNMGNFESVRVDVKVDMPCYKEDVEETYKLISEFTETLMQEQVDEINAGRLKPTGPEKIESPF